jgi:hypothetical protein
LHASARDCSCAAIALHHVQEAATARADAQLPASADEPHHDIPQAVVWKLRERFTHKVLKLLAQARSLPSKHEEDTGPNEADTFQHQSCLFGQAIDNETQAVHAEYGFTEDRSMQDQLLPLKL